MPLRRWLAALIVSFAFAVCGEGRYCVVDGWGTGAGLLPQSSIIAMTQTCDGYLWLGTLNGLVRFDGVHFTVYDESTTPNLTSIQTSELFEDSHSNLWIGTESAGVMLVTNGNVLHIGFGEGHTRGHLISICEDSMGAIWMLTEDRGLARYLNGSVDVWNLEGGQYSSARSVIADKAGLIWVATDRSLTSIDPKRVISRSALPHGDVAAVGQVDFLAPSRAGGYWRLADGRITKCNGTQVVQDIAPYPWPAVSTLVRFIRSAVEDREGNLIVATHGQGVFWFNTNGSFTRICTTNGLANDSVLSMVLDSENSLWVGMDGGGKVEHPLNRVTHSIFTALPASTGKVIQSIAEDQQGRIWFSAKDEDFAVWDGTNVAHTGSSFGTLSRFNPRAVMVDNSNTIWAATYGANLYQWSGALFQPVTNAGQLDPSIAALYQSGDGRIWVGTQHGLSTLDDGAWRTFTSESGLSGNLVRAIAGEPNGNIWVGTEHGGLDLLRSNTFTHFQKTNGFPSDNISCLYAETNGVLWIGTIGNGLIRMEHGAWKHFSTQNGLAGNSIDYIIEDGEDCLWIGANSGLMRVKKKEFELYDANAEDVVSCRSYDIKDGLPATECTAGAQPAACRTRAGLLWFPTIAGMVSVDPREIHLNTNAPPVVIESVYVDQQPQSTNEFRSRPLQEITVPAGRENIEIHYTSLNLAGAARSAFRYRLQDLLGSASRWTAAGRDRVVRYLNLPHGEYRFEVQARNEDGIWNQTGATLAITVLPPFWEQWWFRLTVIAVLLGLVVGTVHYISTQRLNRQLAGLRQQQALDRERARIARDIHDQVGANLTQLSLLGEMVESDKDNPGEAESHGRQITQTARETAHELDEIVWTVNPSNDTLDGLVNYICKHAQEYLAVAGLRYRLDAPAQLPAIPITPEARHNIFLAAKESINNVVKHAHATEMWLRLRLEKNQFTLEIEDNGRGPEGSKSKAAESRNGLRNMRRRMEDIGGSFDIGPGKDGGTLIRLTVPLRIS